MTWWTPQPLELGTERVVRLGQLELAVARASGRVRVAHRLAAEEVVPEYLEPRAPMDPDPSWTVARFAGHREGAELQLQPRTAPRSLVARPDVPFSVVPSGEVKVYVSMPVWVAVRVGGEVVAELPTVSPKPTWFGTFLEGELCFALRTHMRLALSEVKEHAHRAVAPVTIRNQGDDRLHIERLQIPVPQLSLHVDEGGHLRCQELVLIRREGQDHAERKLGKAGPGPALSSAREEAKDNPMFRAFNSVFG